MNIVIVGQGAIGLLWYHALIKSNANQVRLLCSDRVSSPPEQTSITTLAGIIDHQPLNSAGINDITKANLILFCVKSYQVSRTITTLLPKLPKSAVLIFCHNGMIEKTIFSSLSQPCFTLLTTHGSKKIQPFHIQHTGAGLHDLGLIQGNIDVKQQQVIINTLSTALPTLQLTDNIKKKQWLKLAVNCVINPLTAVKNIKNGELVKKEYQQIIDNLLTEIIIVAGYEQIDFNFDELKRHVLQVAEKTAHNCSSMRTDVLNNQPTEIDYINGYIVRLAQQHNIEVPCNKALLAQIRSYEQTKY